MSSPTSRRSQRSSASVTPRSGQRNSAAPQRSPVRATPDAEARPHASQDSLQLPEQQTPRPARSSQNTSQNVSQNLTSSPLFFRSSPSTGPADRTNAFNVSSPLRQQSVEDDGGQTPRAAGQIMGDSSPIRYAPSSSPGRQGTVPRSDAPRSDSSALFVNARATRTPTSARNRRHDIDSDPYDPRRRRLIVDANMNPASDTGTFSDLNANTSDVLDEPISENFIWGTNINISDVRSQVMDFLLNFEKKYRMMRDGDIESTQNLAAHHPGREKPYVKQLNTMLDLGVRTLNLDMKDFKSYPPTTKVWKQMQDFPGEIVPIFDAALKDILYEMAEKRMQEARSQRSQSQHRPQNDNRMRDSSSAPPLPDSDIDASTPRPAPGEQQEIHDLVQEIEGFATRVRPFNLDKVINLRDLNPEDIDKMVSVRGLVIRTTPVIPDMKEAFFRCAVCHHTVRVDIDRGKITEPTVCPREVCASQNSMQIVHNRCGFADKQVIKLQETPDNVPDGQTPHSVSLCCFDELVDVCKAGDRVEITGVFRTNSVRINPRQRSVKNIFKTYLDVVHIQKVDKRRMGIDVSTIEEELAEQAGNPKSRTQETRKVSEEEEARIKEVAARPDVYEILARSLAPSIYEMDDVKKGILLQLFGGTNKSFAKGGSPKYRGDINVLLCGDPSTSKSQLLQYVHKIAPRGVYTSGKGSSAVGLTAYVTRDPETRQLVLESGALVLSDGGVCCIDEFDKMSDSTRSVLHEVMEQQTVSIAKAGIITTLNARTSILASANPIGSKYNPNLPVPQNIDLPPTLLSRFDLVYLVLDRIDEQNDRRLARHLVGMYLEDTPDNASRDEVLPVEFLTSYISYARTNVSPTITQAASDALVSAYVSMRALGSSISAQARRITATTRQLESMIRLSEAHAKMRLSPTVESSDVNEAVRLIQSALKQAATDARTGLIDMSLLTEGTSASERKQREDLKNAVKGVLDEMTRGGGSGVRYTDVVRVLGERSSVVVDAGEFGEVVKELEREGQVQVVGEGARRSLRRVTAIA